MKILHLPSCVYNITPVASKFGYIVIKNTVLDLSAFSDLGLIFKVTAGLLACENIAF